MPEILCRHREEKFLAEVETGYAASIEMTMVNSMRSTEIYHIFKISTEVLQRKPLNAIMK